MSLLYIKILTLFQILNFKDKKDNIKNMTNFLNLFSDPLITIAIVITCISSILLVILGFYYKKIKDQQIISEVVSENTSVREKQNQKTFEEIPNKPIKQIISQQDYEIILAQLNELSSQMNNLTGYVKEISSIISSFKEKVDNNKNYPISVEVIPNLIKVLENLQIEITNLKSKTENSFSSFEEINKKLDNLLKLLSTILQQ